MISYHKIWYRIIAAADAAAETGSNNGKPNFFQEFWLWKWHYEKTKILKFSKTCLPWSGIKFCLEKWSDDVLIFFLDPVYCLQTF